MKSDLEKRLEYVRSQREILQRTEEELQKQLEAEKSDFDFKAKMPVGSVWLGQNQVVSHFPNSAGMVRENDPIMQVIDYNPLNIYHAHRIVKAAQDHYSHRTTLSWIELTSALKAAEKAGVLRNLE